jgi:hypothetical protein
MTYPVETVELALQLRREARSATEISRRIGVPRPTVRDWVAGRVPRRSRLENSCSQCGGAIHDLAALPIDYVYLLGLYLGDGCLSTHPRGVYKLRLALDAKYPAIIDEAAGAMARAMPPSKVAQRLSTSNYIEVYAYSRAWPCLFPQHGPGPKHKRRIKLAAWQWELVERAPRLLIKGLIHSDGCRFMNTGRKWRHPRYAFSNASQDIRGIFCDACDLLGIHYTYAPRKVYVSRKVDVALLDEFIGPKC